jgi:hypothetical protein
MTGGADATKLVEGILANMKASGSMELDSSSPARSKLNYVADMVHFAKLRSTLLAEYGA